MSNLNAALHILRSYGSLHEQYDAEVQILKERFRGCLSTIESFLNDVTQVICLTSNIMKSVYGDGSFFARGNVRSKEHWLGTYMHLSLRGHLAPVVMRACQPPRGNFANSHDDAFAARTLLARMAANHRKNLLNTLNEPPIRVSISAFVDEYVAPNGTPANRSRASSGMGVVGSYIRIIPSRADDR